MAQLLGINLSPFVRKVLLYVNEAGIELEHDDSVLPTPKTDLLLSVNPRGKIPAYRDDDVSLGESSVICAYLEKKHGPTEERMHRVWPMLPHAHSARPTQAVLLRLA